MNTEDLKHTYNKIADDYFEDHKDDTWDDDHLSIFTEKLAPGSVVLDLGCGPGVESRKLNEKGLTVHGLDLSGELLAIAKKQTPEATFIEGSMLDPLPYDNDFFDGVFAKASLLHVPKKEIDFVMSEILRVLKKGGYLHLALKQGDGEKETTENGYGYEYKRQFSFWMPKELNELFAKYDLELIKKDKWLKPEVNTVWLKYILKK